nr:helix-turn-helix domain-containing protein [Endozoicomonas sp. YOMI1]
MEKNVTNWTDRVKSKAQEQNLKNVDIARAVGCTEGTYSLWMSGARNPKLNNKIAIADVLGVSIHWLETGEELPDPKTLPYISLDKASAFFDELDERRQQVLSESAICIIESDHKSFLLRMENDTMVNQTPSDMAISIPKGAKVQVDTVIAPEPGKILLIEHDGELSLRLWNPISKSQHSLRFINRLYGTFDLNYAGDIKDIYKGTAVGVSFLL